VADLNEITYQFTLFIFSNLFASLIHSASGSSSAREAPNESATDVGGERPTTGGRGRGRGKGRGRGLGYWFSL
jgi:hypothetical protein